jgi:uncharacterized alpha-E superfamily protein
MISRVAEHCYWLARYLERAENTARVLEVNHTLLLDFHVPVDRQWRPVLIISGIHDFDKEATTEAVQEFMTWDPENRCSIVASLGAARENARIIREVISVEMWERINFYHLWLQGPASRTVFDTDRHEFYAQVRRINQLVHGICDATMSHGEAWEFFRLGAHLERGSQTARILDVKYHMLLPAVEDIGTPADNAHWVAILMSCSGYEPFHKKPRPLPMDPGLAVAEFLIFDDQFPRSIRRCLWECETALAAAAGSSPGRTPTEPESKVRELIWWLDRRSITDLIREGLHESLTHVVDSAHEIGEGIHHVFFAPEFKPPSPSQSLDGKTQTQSMGGMTQRQQ